jgi:hypothetical protein
LTILCQSKHPIKKILSNDKAPNGKLMIFTNISRDRKIQWILTLVILFFGVLSCKNTETTDSSDSGLLANFAASEWQVRLRDGRTIHTEDYRLDADTNNILQSLIDNEYKDHADFFRTKKIDKPELSFPEAFCTYLYTRWFYLEFVKYLSGRPGEVYHQNLSESQVASIFLGVVSAVNKMKKFQGTTFFGAVLSESVVEENLKSGKLYLQENFTSMSQDLIVAENFAEVDKAVPNAEKASVVFELRQGTSGVDIRSIGFDIESEVLFSPMRPFIVKNTKKVRPFRSENGVNFPAVYRVLLEEK